MTALDDEQAFSELFTAHSEDVFAYLLRRCATAEDAADCLAETWLIAWRKHDTIPVGEQARPWLFGVARNVMRRGHERRRREVAANRELQAAADSLAAAAATVGAVEEPGLPDALTVPLRSLPEIDREILALVAFEGLTPAEVAVVLDLSPNVVRVRAHRARAKLRARLRARSDPVQLKAAARNA